MSNAVVGARYVARNTSGQIVPGVRIFTYEAGTLTPKTTFQDAGLSVPHTNPIVCDANGSAAFYLSPTGYRLRFVNPASQDDNLFLPDGDIDSVFGWSFSISADLANATAPAAGAGLVGYSASTGYSTGLGLFLNNIYARTAEEIAAGVTPTNYHRLPGDLRRYGATGDGVTNDRDAIRNAILVAEQGTRLFAHKEDVYFVGTFPNTTGEDKFTIDFDGFWFEPNGCKFKATANMHASLAGSYLQNLFVIESSNFYIGDMTVEADAVAVPPATQQGVAALVLSNTTRSTKNGRLGDIKGVRLMATLVAASNSPATRRHAGLTWGRLSNEDGYYTLNCADNLDHASGVVQTSFGVRSYFVYGVRGHSITIDNPSHRAFTDVVVKAYEFDTGDIDIKYTCQSDESSDASVSLEHQSNTQGRRIYNVSIDIGVTKSNPANPTIRFVAFEADGTVRTNTSSTWENIRITGVTNSTTPTMFSTGCTGNNPSRLFMDESLLFNVLDYKRFIVLDHNSRQGAIGSAANGMLLEFNVSLWQPYPAWGRLTVWGADNGVTTGANYFVRELWVKFSTASDGATTIDANSTINTFTADPGGFSPGVSLAGYSAGNYKITAQITGYTGANRYCRGWLDIMGVQP